MRADKIPTAYANHREDSRTFARIIGPIVEIDSMTPDEAWNLVTSDPMPQRMRMLLTISAACLEGRNQHDLAEWCCDTGDDDACKIWCRAVAVMKLPADVRWAAEWN